MPWTFYNASGQRLSSAATNISVLDINGATDIGAAIVDADLFIVDDNASGTNRKTTASRLVTYVGANTDTRSGVAKVWVNWEQTGAHSRIDSYGMDSATDGTGVGDTDHLFSTPFANTTYALAGMGQPNTVIIYLASSRAVDGITTYTANAETAAYQDSSDNTLVIFGDS